MQMVSRRSTQWLAAAADDPEGCRAVWADDPRKPYLLPTGRLFDVVVVCQRVGMETFDQLSRRSMPLGPVIADWGNRELGFFVPVGSEELFAGLLDAETAEVPEYRYVGAQAYVVVPGPMALSGDQHEWLRAPIRPPEVVPELVSALAVMFAAAACLVSRAERYGKERRRPVIEAPGTDESAGR